MENSKTSVKNNKIIKKEKTLSRLFLEPLLKDNCITEKMLGIYLYNAYSESPCNKRIWVLYQDLLESDIKLLELNDLFVSSKEIEGSFYLLEFLIPYQFIGDVACISVGMYTVTSSEFKDTVLSYWKKKEKTHKNFYEELNKVLNPTEEVYKELSSDLLLDIKYKEVSEMFCPLRESFRLSNFLSVR